MTCACICLYLPDPPFFQEGITCFLGSLEQPSTPWLFPVSAPLPSSFSDLLSSVEPPARAPPQPPNLLSPWACLCSLVKARQVGRSARAVWHCFLVEGWDGSGIKTLGCPIAKEGLWSPCREALGPWILLVSDYLVTLLVFFPAGGTRIKGSHCNKIASVLTKHFQCLFNPHTYPKR